MTLDLIRAPALTRAFVETVPAALVNERGAAGNLNQATYYLVRVPGSKPLRVTTATWYVGAAAGNVDAGIGTISGTTFTLLGSTGATAASGTNARQSAALTSAVSLMPDRDYYIALSVSNVDTLTVGRFVNLNALFGIDCYYKASEQPLTTGVTVSAGTNSVNLIPWVRLS